MNLYLVRYHEEVRGLETDGPFGHQVWILNDDRVHYYAIQEELASLMRGIDWDHVESTLRKRRRVGFVRYRKD
jgi:hypothetical protein